MNIDKLEAGRELDALIAEKVMGWRLRYYLTGVSVVVGDDLEDILWYEDTVRWSPSTDTAAAWEVIEKLNSPDASITLETGTRNGESVWWCVFIIGDDRHKCAAASTPPLAICRAALKAVA